MGNISPHFLDGKIQKLTIWRYCEHFAFFSAHFHPEKGQEGTIFSWRQVQNGRKHLKNDQIQVMMKFWKLAISITSMKYVVVKLDYRFTVQPYCVGKQTFSHRERILQACPSSSSWWKWSMKKLIVFTTVFVRH